jgi:hypothetical protein
MLTVVQLVEGNSAQEYRQLLMGNTLKNLHSLKGNNAQVVAVCERKYRSRM